MKHAEAREIVRSVLSRLLPGCNEDAVSICTAIAFLESNYGRSWTGPMKGSKNWGAVQAGGSWHGAVALQGDTYVSTSGGTVRYTRKFRVYETDDQAAEDFCRIVIGYGGRAVPALLSGDVLGVSQALRLHRAKKDGGQDLVGRLGYYEGHGASPEIREHNHAAAIWSALIQAGKEIGCGTVQGLPTPPTVRAGDVGPWCNMIRSCLGLPQGEDFPVQAVRDFQVGRRLTPDATVGPATWGYLLSYRGWP
jgi:hypothetical protein